MRQSLIRYLPLLLLAIAWEVVARLELVSTSALPPLSDVVAAGIAIQLGISATSPEFFGGSPLNRALNVFAFFTIQSNIILLVT